MIKEIKPEDVELLKIFEAWLKKAQSTCNDCDYVTTSTIEVCPMCGCTDIYTTK